MKRMLTMLWIPLVIELVNILVHHVLRDSSEGINWIDDISIAITVAVVFFAGWTVARKINRLGLAILGALLIWVCSVLLVLVLIGVESMLGPAPASAADVLVMKGFVLSAFLSIPVVIVVSGVAAAIARRTRPSGS